jgi:uncharacterized protein (DUF169 family)
MRNVSAAEQNAQDLAAIDTLLCLRHPPVALKLIEPGESVPEIAYKPNEQEKKHIALCQAFALARRDGKTVYMRREDHWCWNPLIAFGHIKCEEKSDPGFEIICRTIGIADPAAAERFVSGFMKLPLNKYEGILLAPLDKADFEPDIWLIYCDNGQLRTILRAVKTQTGALLKSEFDALDSCLYSVIPPILNGDYRITLPDPGEYERALTDENTVIFSVPAVRYTEFRAGAALLNSMRMGNKSLHMEMKADFARPQFYNDLYEAWGLEKGEVWRFDRP